MTVASIAQGVYLVDTGGLGYENTVAAYLIVGKRYAAFVDVGYARGLPRLLDAIREVGIGPSSLRYIIPTHVHLDHCGATGLLAHHYESAEVYAHERAVKHIVDPSRLVESARTLYGDAVFTVFGETRPVPEGRVYAVKNEENIELGGITLRAVYAPGHAPHHMVIFIEEPRCLVSADTFSMRFPFFKIPIPTSPPPSFELELAIQSMENVYKLEPRLLLTPHFGPLLPSTKLLEEDIAAYRSWADRVKTLQREGKGVDESVNVFLEEMRSRVGGDLHPAVRSATRISVIGLYTYFSKGSST